jgi:hypothetical protein
METVATHRPHLVIISDLYIKRIPFLPNKTDPPLIVNPDAVLAGSVLLKGFEMVSSI